MPDKKDIQIVVPGMRNVGRAGFGAAGVSRFSPQEKAKNVKGTFRRLIRYYLLEGRTLFLVAGMLAVQTALSVAAPLLVGRSVDNMTG